MGSTWQCDHALRNGSRKDVQCPNPALQDWVSGIEGAVMCGLLGACTDALQDFQGLRHLEMSEINMVIDQFVPRLRSTLSRAAPTGKAVASDFFHFGKLASAQNELTTGPMYSSESDSSQPDLELARMCSAAVQGITQTDDAVGRTASEDILRLASAYSGSYASAVQGITQTDDAVGRTASEEILRLASASSGSYAFSSVHNADEVKLLSIQNFLTFTQKLTPSTEQEEQEEDEFVDFATHNFQSIRKSMVAMKSQSKLASFQSLKQSLTFADDIQLTTHEQERYIDSPAAAHHLQSLKNLANVSMVSVGQHLALESMHGASGDLTANARKSTALRPLPEAQSFDNVTCLFFDIVEFSKVSACVSCVCLRIVGGRAVFVSASETKGRLQGGGCQCNSASLQPGPPSSLALFPPISNILLRMSFAASSSSLHPGMHAAIAGGRRGVAAGHPRRGRRAHAAAARADRRDPRRLLHLPHRHQPCTAPLSSPAAVRRFASVASEHAYTRTFCLLPSGRDPRVWEGRARFDLGMRGAAGSRGRVREPGLKDAGVRVRGAARPPRAPQHPAAHRHCRRFTHAHAHAHTPAHNSSQQLTTPHPTRHARTHTHTTQLGDT
eukprot:1333677-Rhodomonas_salina.2